MNRRAFVASLSGSLLVGGCLGRSTPGSDSHDSKDASEIERNVTDWEPSVQCHEERNSMYVSDIQVTEVRASLDDDDVAVHFADLTAKEKEILRTVTEDGGYDTCRISDAFSRFRERMDNHAEGLDRRRDEHVYLERDGVYYRLTIMITDQGFAY